GPLQVLRDGQDVTPPGVRLRALLCRLAVDPGRRVSSDELAEAVWADELPADPTNALQSLVSRLRRSLGSGGLVTQEPTGYRLALGEQDVDASRLRLEVARGDAAQREEDLATAGRAYAAALALWRGDPLVDAGEAPYVSGQVRSWEALRLNAARGRAECALATGTAATVVDELGELALAHPLDERLRLLLMRTLAAAGRSAEALAAYEEARRVLADELGTDPGPALVALHLQLLRGEVDPVPEPEPAARPGATRRSNLPARRTSFVGREPELERVLAALETSRLVSVVGPGGAGKTRLAVEAATRWLDATDGSAWLVELAPVTEPGAVADAAAIALGLRDARLTTTTERPLDAVDRLVLALRGTRTLLVVDNCEHLIDAAAGLVDRVLREAPETRVLATSREALAVDGEVLAPLSPLPLPPLDVDVQTALTHPAVRLWLDRAVAVAPGFALDETTVAPVVEIVRRLDGLPLAIELAAARLGVLPVAEVARRLSDRFRLLTGGNRAGLPRHRTLRAVVGWSWDLLSPAERLLAERLAVFLGGADAEAVLAVCADARLPAAEIDALLLSLVEKSLLQATVAEGRLRFTMLETLREYGADRLADHGELPAVQAAHAAYLARLVEQLEPVLRGPDQLVALARLDRERENVLAALHHLADAGRGDAALRMCLALAWYWSLLDSAEEAASRIRAVLGVEGASTRPERAYAEASLVVSELFSWEDADGLGGWATARARLSGLADQLADVPAPFPGLAVLRAMVGAFAFRADLVDRFVAEAEVEDDPWVRVAVQITLASAAENAGDTATMRRAATTAHEGFRVLGDRWGLSSSLLVLGRLATLDGDLDTAVAAYEEAAGLVSTLGSTEDDIYLRIRLADLLNRQGHPDRARAAVAELVRGDRDERTAGERELIADAVLTALDLQVGDTTAARAGAARLREHAASRSPESPLAGHVVSICLGTAATVAAALGDAAQAATDLAAAYPAARATQDMP
ncbi:MAG: BTAD domain-containing putative transcriptional regulator, partial [Janthinobacterium lividum]